MTTASHEEGCLLERAGLHSDETCNGVSEGKPGRDGAKDSNEHSKAKAQEEQPHTPTRNRLRQGHSHFTLSY